MAKQGRRRLCAQVESSPAVIKKGLSKEAAEEVQKKLESGALWAGACPNRLCPLFPLY